MSDVVRVWAKRPFGYGTFPRLSRGQVFELSRQPNDEKLLRLGYVEELRKNVTTFQCAVCGAEFIGESERLSHGQTVHATRVRTPFEEDQLLEREEKLLAEVAPLNLENTAASKK